MATEPRAERRIPDGDAATALRSRIAPSEHECLRKQHALLGQIQCETPGVWGDDAREDLVLQVTFTGNAIASGGATLAADYRAKAAALRGALRPPAD